MSQRHTILLMDEDAETLEQLQTMLLRERYHVLAAADGHAALRLAHTAKPDLIVSDLLLAGLDGYEVWKVLRNEKETAHIPIIVTSALTVPTYNQPWRPTPDSEWQLLTYDAYLPKPIDLHRFMRVVEKLLNPNQADTIPSGPSVILAITNESTQGDLADFLREYDFGVRTADSFGEVLRIARAVPPAALVLDYRKPDEAIQTLISQINKFVPNVVIIPIIDPQQELPPDVEACCDGFLNLPLHPAHTTNTINHILELTSMRRRTQTLSTQLITTHWGLQDTQQMLKAQNDELEYVNAQLRELDNLKEMFTNMVVHDLKSPLGAVLGALNYLQNATDCTVDSTNHMLLTGATAAGNQMLRLIETLLERQRLEDGHLKPDAEPFDFTRIIDTCVQQVASLLTLHKINTKIVANELPPVYADPHISQRILENLLDNAIKFSPKSGNITIKAIPADDFLTISIQDEGPGIAEEQQAEIFDLFAQLENIASAKRVGFGLGLTFCHLAIQAMHGAIWVESDGSSGTTFLFTLPLYKEEKEPS